MPRYGLPAASHAFSGSHSACSFKMRTLSPKAPWPAGGEDVADCAELVAMGYMRSFRSQWLPYFNCTVADKGKEAVRRESPVPPTLTRSQKRYLRFLDADSGLSFGEWLKAGYR